MREAGHLVAELRPLHVCVAKVELPLRERAADHGHVSAVAVDGHNAAELGTSAVDDLNQHLRQHPSTHREGSGETAVLIGGADADRGRHANRIQTKSHAVGDRLGNPRVGVERKVWAVLFGGTQGKQQGQRAGLGAVGGYFSRGV